MKRSPAAAIVQRLLRPDDVVVCGLGSTGFAWSEQQPRQLTYWASDPMGIWPSFALGLALAQPKRRVIFLEGDGDLLMNLQVLLTIAGAAPANLKMAVFHNGSYASAGGSPLPGMPGADLASICRGAGVATAEAADEAEAERALAALLAGPGLGAVILRLEEEPPADSPHGPWSQAEDRAGFMRSLLGDRPFG